MRRNIPLYFFSNTPIPTACGRILDQYTCVQVNKPDQMPDRAIEWATENLRGFESKGYDPMHKEVIWSFDLPDNWEPCPALKVPRDHWVRDYPLLKAWPLLLKWMETPSAYSA